MRVMVMIKATKNSEAGVMPSAELLAEMGRFNEALLKAGVLIAGEGLHPSRRGKRVRLLRGARRVTDGPFAAREGLVAGFWLWNVRSMDEAVEWAKRCPDPMPAEQAEIEIRPIFEADDFGSEFTPELRKRERELRAEVQRRRANRPAREGTDTLDRIEAYDKSVPAPHRDIVALLHREIVGVLKNAEVKLWHAMPVWFIDGNPVVGYKSGRNGVTLLFWNGQAFKEPGLAAAGKFRAAQVHLVSEEQIRVTDLRRWLRKAAKDVWDYQALRRGLL